MSFVNRPRLRVVPKDQKPNDDFPRVEYACDVAPSRCPECQLPQCRKFTFDPRKYPPLKGKK